MLESKRLHSEVKVQKARISSLEISVEASRKKLDEAKDVLARKRSKKRRCVCTCLAVRALGSVCAWLCAHQALCALGSAHAWLWLACAVNQQ